MKKLKIRVWLPLILMFPTFGMGQEPEFISSIYESYETYREPALDKRRIKYNELQPLINHLLKDPRFTVEKVGSSIEGRDLNLISIGKGTTNVFLWSQMHGDEPTATQAIFDILNFLKSDNFRDGKETMLNNLTLHFLPMLNPDGAEAYERRNRLGIDINRDALDLQSPEGRTLKRVRDSLQADFGFNLHDQSTYYNAERTDKPATISYLAPAYNYEKEINGVRERAMKVIAYMNNIIQKYAPGQVGRYDDAFEPRAFGDNIQKWGTSAILIESGGYANDIEKQEIRKLNYVSILAAIYSISKGNYATIPLSEYGKIPENDRKLFDLKITDATYELLGKSYLIDIGINYIEVDIEGKQDFWYSNRIIDMGDLSTYYGYEILDAHGYNLKQGKVYPELITSIDDLIALDEASLIRSGYTYIRMEKIPANLTESPVSLHLIGKGFVVPEFNMKVGNNPTFLLEKDGKICHTIINGFLVNLESNKGQIKNAMIYR